MTKAVLGQLHADDFVITLDLARDTARVIADGSYGLTSAGVLHQVLVEQSEVDAY